ncbi:MAG: long-chain fatty acid--CoA ligase [Candidatus Heimdallarchaeota archaeon]|nr:long-chain fatty acid--CoA ligase [Candidatus Heimdallarchaeota archaeon]
MTEETAPVESTPKTTTEIPTPWLDSLEGVRATSLDYEEMTMYQFLKRRAKNEPDDPFMIFPAGKTTSYAETIESVEKIGAFLLSKGIKKGDRVTLFLPNLQHYVISHYAVLAIGAIVVQGNPRYTLPELTHLLEDSGSRAIISISQFQDIVGKAMKSSKVEFAIFGHVSDYLPMIKGFLGRLLGKVEDVKIAESNNVFSFKKLLKSTDKSGFKEADISLEDDVAVLQYTGGTTGKSKGAILTHKNLCYNSQQARALIPMIPDKTGSILTMLPLFHSFGLTICMGMCLQMGIPMILIPKPGRDQKFFAEVLDMIEKYEITFFPGVPTMLNAMVNNSAFETANLSSLIAVFSGGATLPLAVSQRFKKVTGADVVEGYGLSETSPLATCNPIKSEKLQPKEGSIGLPAPDTVLKIVDQDNASVNMALGERGEIAIKGPQVMRGYWNSEEESKIALDGEWLLTGDIGKMDEDGYFYIVDRKKDIIIVSGFNVIPNEIENVLYQHPAILEAAVAGIPHPEKGETPAAWVVLREGMSADSADIVKFLRESLAGHKIPSEIHFREELPKTMIGKILRRKLKEELLGE